MRSLRSRVLRAVILFGGAAMIGPLLYAGTELYTLTSALWPMSILGLYETSVGRVGAFLLAIAGNLALFLLLGIVAAFPRNTATYVVTVASSLMALLAAATARYGNQATSYVLLAGFLIALYVLFGYLRRIEESN